MVEANISQLKPVELRRTTYSLGQVFDRYLYQYPAKLVARPLLKAGLILYNYASIAEGGSTFTPGPMEEEIVRR
jgi:hypothetical protein